MAVSFGTSPTASSRDVDPSDRSSFYNDDLQEYLLGFFTVDGKRVDPYDGASFRRQQLDTLIDSLQTAAELVAAEPAEWPFTDEQQLTRYFESCRLYHIDPLKPRDQALRVVREAITLATKAKSRDEFLVFEGD